MLRQKWMSADEKIMNMDFYSKFKHRILVK